MTDAETSGAHVDSRPTPDGAAPGGRGPQASAQPEPALSPIALRHLPAATQICLTTHGAYWKLSGTFARLRSWMNEAGVEPAGAALGLFYDDPGVLPPEACRYSICYPLDGNGADRAAEALAAGRPPLPPHAHAPADGPDATPAQSPARPPFPDTLSVDTMVQTTVAAIEYAGPAAESPTVYERLACWVKEQGLTPEGPPREVYLAEPGTLGKGMMHAEVQQPVLAP